MKHFVLTTALAAALLAAGPASAQLARNSDAPIDITADELEVAQTGCSSVWRGDAEALQADTRLRANVLKAFFQPRAGGTGSGACGDLIRMEAEGAVYYVTPQQRVRADAAIYDAAGESLVMSGDVVAVQGQNVLRGSRMIVDLKTNRGRMLGSATGRNQAGRPRGVFYPSQKSDPAR